MIDVKVRMKQAGKCRVEFRELVLVSTVNLHKVLFVRNGITNELFVLR